MGVETTSFASRIDYEEHSLHRNSLYRPNVKSHDENARGDVAAPAKRIVDVGALAHGCADRDAFPRARSTCVANELSGGRT